MDIITLNKYQDILIKNAWTKNPGNYVIFTYYDSDCPENPSGNDNIKTIEYFDNKNQLILTERYEWDDNDNIVKIIAE
jgi:hypothetical protein